jgi:hypothetical protein
VFDILIRENAGAGGGGGGGGGATSSSFVWSFKDTHAKATPLRNEKGVKIRGIYWYKVENPICVKRLH